MIAIRNTLKENQKSNTHPLKQPASLFAIFLGGLSLFNTARGLGWIDDETLIAYLDWLYVFLRDAIFMPLETSFGIEVPYWVKNLFVLYLVIARAYGSAVNFLRKEFETPATSDFGHRRVSRTYPPFDKGPVKRKYAIINWVAGNFSVKWQKAAVKVILKTLSSFTWPYGIRSIIKFPALSISVRGADKVGQPHPADPREIELPPVDGLTGQLQTSPKFPATGSSETPIYDARIILITFVVAQILFALLLTGANAALPDLGLEEQPLAPQPTNEN